VRRGEFVIPLVFDYPVALDNQAERLAVDGGKEFGMAVELKLDIAGNAWGLGLTLECRPRYCM
jgi:hypothetical protein